MPNDLNEVESDNNGKTTTTTNSKKRMRSSSYSTKTIDVGVSGAISAHVFVSSNEQSAATVAATAMDMDIEGSSVSVCDASSVGVGTTGNHNIEGRKTFLRAISGAGGENDTDDFFFDGVLTTKETNGVLATTTTVGSAVGSKDLASFGFGSGSMTSASSSASMLPSVVEMLHQSGRLDNEPVQIRADMNGNITEWNDKAMDVLGWSGEETHHKNIISNFVLPELQPMAQQIFNDGIKGRKCEFVMEVKSKFGETIFLLINTTPVINPKDNCIVGLSAVCRDVTREAMFDLAARAIVTDNQTLIQTANAPIFGVDTTLKATVWNEYCIATTGLVGRLVLGKPFIENLIIPSCQDEATNAFNHALLHGQPTKGLELEVQCKNRKDTRVWKLNIAPRFDGCGNVFGAIGVAQDVTEDRKLAKQLKQMEIVNKIQEESLDAERGATAYFAHELRNPLNAIDSALQSMPDDLPDSTKSLVDAMQLCTDFMSSIMNNLLDARKLDEGKVVLRQEPMSITHLLNKVHGMLSPSVRPEVSFKVDCSPNMENDWLLGDSDRIQQVLTNVVSNAIKHTVAGSITLRAMWQNDPINAMRIECIDTGPGIPICEQGKIFEKFFQRGGAPGSGLGLAIAKGVVDLCGGSIYFDSDPTQKPGTTCVIILPLKPCSGYRDGEEEGLLSQDNDEYNNTGNDNNNNKANEIKMMSSSSSSVPLQTIVIEAPLSILIVDDIKINRTMLSRRIKKGIAPNSTVYEAETGEAALELCKKIQFHCIFVDQYYAEAGGVMVGTDVIIAMRRDVGTDAIIIGCSAGDNDTSFRDAGSDLVWGKPLPSNTVVIEQLSKLLINKGIKINKDKDENHAN